MTWTPVPQSDGFRLNKITKKKRKNCNSKFSDFNTNVFTFDFKICSVKPKDLKVCYLKIVPQFNYFLHFLNQLMLTPLVQN